MLLAGYVEIIGCIIPLSDLLLIFFFGFITTISVSVYILFEAYKYFNVLVKEE